MGIRRKWSSRSVEARLAALDEEAMDLYGRGHVGEAISIATQQCELARKHLGPGHPEVALVLNNLAFLHRAAGNYATAERLFREALHIARQTRGEQHPDVALCLNNLGELCATMAAYAEAERLLQRALQIRRATLGEEHRLTATTLNNLGELYRVTGRLQEAGHMHRAALVIKRRALPVNDPSLATTLHNLGLVHHALGDYAAAEPLLYEAAQIRRSVLGDQHPTLASTLDSLAGLYRAIGDTASAEALYLRALAIKHGVLGAEHPSTVLTLHNQAELYWAMERYAEAEPLYQRVLEIRRRVLGEGHPDVAASMNNLALLYQDMERYTEAEVLHVQALEIRRRALGDGHPDVAGSLNNLGWLHQERGDYAQAKVLYRQALNIKRTALGEQHPSYAVSLDNLAIVCAATGAPDEAMALVQKAAAIGDYLIGQVFSIASESQRLAYLQTLRAELGFLLSLVSLRFAHSAEACGLALDSVLRRKGLGAEAVSVQRDAVLSSRHPDLQTKLQELARLRTQIGQQTLTGPGSEGIEAYEQSLVRWTAQKEALEAELARQIPEVNLQRTLRAADRRAVASALPAGSALVEFMRFEGLDLSNLPGRWSGWQPARYLALVLAAGRPDDVQLVDLGEAEAIELGIAAFRESIASGNRDLLLGRPAAVVAGRDGQALRAAVFDPLLPAISSCTQLFLAPDGDLNLLPFEALPTADGAHLIERYRFSYLSTGRDALRFGRRPGQFGPPLVAADPNFDLGGGPGQPAAGATTPVGRCSRDLSRSSARFERLPGTREEGQRIAGLLGVSPLLGDQVLESVLKAHRSPRFLHLATHGFFLADQTAPERFLSGLDGSERLARLATLENPLLRSGLALAGANTWLQGGSPPDPAQDGLLTAEDVAGLDLSDTELVVLSACQTGLGQVRAGEGVFGLRRAFVLAGARTLIMSLWKVPDQSTQELMIEFYQYLQQGKSRAEALRQAQLSLRSRYPKVMHWGAFICHGDPGPLPQNWMEKPRPTGGPNGLSAL